MSKLNNFDSEKLFNLHNGIIHFEQKYTSKIIQFAQFNYVQIELNAQFFEQTAQFFEQLKKRFLTKRYWCK